MVTRKALPVVVIQTRPMSSAKNKVTDEFKPDDEYEYEDDDKNDSQPMGQVIVKLAKGQEQSKASTCQTGADKVKGKDKCPQPKPIGSVLLPCKRCTSMKVDCEPWMNKRGSIAHTCTLCNKWRMRCIRPEQLDTLTTPTGPTPTSIPPVFPITTRSKTTRKGKTGENSKGTDINTPRPAPIPEELAVDIKMLDDPPAGISTGLPDTAPDAAPLASADDFPLDHWIKPMDDSTLPPAPFVDTPGNVWPTIQTNWVPREDWWIIWPFSDGSPVTRCKAPTYAPASTINPVPTMGQSSSLTDLAGALPVPLPTVVMESMPSTSAICTSLTGPSNVPADGQSISAPLPNQSFGPQSRQGQSVGGDGVSRHVLPVHTGYQGIYYLYIPGSICPDSVVYVLTQYVQLVYAQIPGGACPDTQYI
ncbi:hypothetical protein BDR04DRAFT_1116554 [Suillus decipiens]|nr:hypothetical protein BDR04DRAFT_1116554 [Suillus decipiens]